MRPKIFSFFAGSGFLDLGFEKSGFDVVYVNEIHKPFLDAYKHSRRKMKLREPEFGYHEGSITDLLLARNSKKLKGIVQESKRSDLVGFIGGSPCPDFSVAGKNRGSLGEKGKLSKTYIEIICNQEPDFFLFENVKGLWQTKRHRRFYEELKLLVSSVGYLVDEHLINSIEYGVAQDRERIIMIGFHKRLFPELMSKEPPSIKFPFLKHAVYEKAEVFGYDWLDISPFLEDVELPCPEGIPKKLTVQYWFDKNNVDSHPNSKHCFRPIAGLKRFQDVSEGDDKKKSFKRLHRWRYSPTAAYGNNEVHLHPYKARRINAAEAMAIQSLPESFELPADMTLSNMFKTIGNGVPYLAGKALARTLSEFLEGMARND